MPELVGATGKMYVGEGVVTVRIEAIEQPADPFDGLADCVIHPLAFELMQERESRRTLLDSMSAYEAQRAKLVALLNQPLSKLKVKDLRLLISTGRDLLADNGLKAG